jgi:hypothetical protein
VGLDCASVKFLCAAKSMGVDFTNTMMVGRQTFYPNRTTLDLVSAALRIPFDSAALLNKSKFGEPFFTLLGAEQVSSLDVSAYEDATYIHDMNLPIPIGLSQGFSAVHDGGTIEHVFNFPQALKNCMEMVRVGGHFTQVNVANNFMGHGFWQFSPELIYRAFSPENGFRVEAVLLHEVVPQGAWYAVQSPDEVRHRVELCNNAPTYILTIAKRIALKEIFAKAPQQSDYAAVWSGDSWGWQAPPQRPTEISRMTPYWLRRFIPQRVVHLLRRAGKRPSPFSATYYRQIKEDNLLRGQIWSASR